MKNYLLTQVSDRALIRDLKSLVMQDRAATAAMLAHIAEVDSRKLYVPAGYSSMHVYCVEELRFSDETAYKRIRVARNARRFPSIFTALAEGRLNLSSVILLAPYLTESTVDLIEAAAHKKNCEIQTLLAERFPQPDLPTRMEVVGAASPPPMRDAQLAVRPVVDPTLPEIGVQLAEPVTTSKHQAGPADELASSQPEALPEQFVQPLSCQLAVRPVEASTSRPRVTPIAPDRVALQVTVSQRAADNLQYAQELLGFRIEHGDIAEVLERALDALIVELEKTKFAATGNPRATGRPVSKNERYIPSRVKRQVWKRDGGRCTFVSPTGHRCEYRRDLEFDHVEEFLRGGRSSVDNVRLLCRAHNQYMAECTFGAEFMRAKRQKARAAATVRAGTVSSPIGTASIQNAP